MVRLKTWQIVLQQQDAHAPPLVVGGEDLLSRLDHRGPDRAGHTKIPDIIMKGHQVRQDLRESVITLLGGLYLNPDDLSSFHRNRIEDPRFVSGKDFPAAIFFGCVARRKLIW